MISKLGEVFGGVSGGKRGILSSKGFLSLPLRIKFYPSVTSQFAISYTDRLKFKFLVCPLCAYQKILYLFAMGVV